MITKKTWKEFHESGMLWWINRLLHTFGWAIVIEVGEDEVGSPPQARLTYRDQRCSRPRRVPRNLTGNLE